MVIKKTFIFIFIFFYFKSIAQNSFFDEIRLMDYQRNIKLLNDSNDLIKNSFFIRSTSSFQYLQSNFTNRTKNIVQSIFVNYDQQNNSLLPASFNDGNMYPSRGWQERYSLGLNLNFWILDINFQPEKLLVQNKIQEPYYGNPNDGNFMFKYFGMVANNIDNFRQFGYDPIEETTLGQSRLGLKTKYLSAGISNENIWWGPGKRNSLIFTNNAAGFKHIYLKTLEPIPTVIGDFELNGIIGKLDTTRYNDIDQELLNICRPCMVFKNLNERQIDAITINWQPKWIPGLYIGYSYSRQYYRDTTNALGEKYTFFSHDRPKQELGSLMFRFALPKGHAEFYTEIGMPDETPWPWKFFKNDVRLGYIAGVTKLVPLNFLNSYINLNVEFTQLQIMDPRKYMYIGNPTAGSFPFSWYLSSIVKQGYSNNGQLMASSIGPGSNNQSISLSWNKGYNKIGVFVERTVYNNDFYNTAYITPYFGTWIVETGEIRYGYYNRYWVDLTQRLELQLMPIKNLLLSASFTKTHALNYRWIRIDDGSAYDAPSIYTDKYNQQFQMSIKFLLHAIIK